MSLTDIASYIGAAAWLYPIYIEIRKKNMKPSVSLFPVDSIQLGYTNFGPIIYLQCAIDAEKLEALIIRIEIEVVHKDGESHTLTWRTLDETQFQIRSFSGEGGGTIERSQLATAIKISTAIPIDKRIGFVDLKYQEKCQELIDRLAKKMSYKKHISPEFNFDFNEMFKEQEFVELNGYFTKEMYWKVGKYELNISIYVSSLKKPLIKEYEFELDAQKIDFITINSTLLKESFKAAIPQSPQVNWNWAYPKITMK